MKSSKQPVEKSTTTKFSEIVTTHQRQALSIAMNYVNNLDDAKVIVYKSYLRVLKHLHRGKTKAEVGPLFYEVLIQVCQKHSGLAYRFAYKLTGRAPEPSSDFDAFIGEGGSEDTVDTLLQQRIYAAVRKLPKLQRSSFVLRFYEDMSVQDMSRVLHRSTHKISLALHRALMKIRYGKV